MGHTILQWVMVTGVNYTRPYMEQARAQALTLFGERSVVGEIQQTPVNQHWWFIVGPSGSKLGWPEEEAHSKAIAGLVEWLKAFRYESYPGHGGCNPLHWVVLSQDEDGDRFTIDDEGEDHDRGDL